MSNSTEEKSDYYTYGLANPLKPTKERYIGGDSLYDYEFFYIGFTGSEKRLSQHLACYDSDTNYHKKNTIKKIQRNGEEVIFVKILMNVTKQEAKAEEIRKIAYYGRADKGLGPLTNMTDGGDGISDGDGHPNYGKQVYNNGKTMGFFVIGTEPEGWIKGGLSINVGEDNFGKGKKWYNNGTRHEYFYKGEQSKGWVLGRLLVKESHPRFGAEGAASGKKWYNDGIEDKYFYDGEQPEGWTVGRISIRGKKHGTYKLNLKGENHPRYGKTGTECPNFGKKHYNNGKIIKTFNEGEQPDGWILGRLSSQKEKIKNDPDKYRWYNNGKVNEKIRPTKVPTNEGWVEGMIPNQKYYNNGILNKKCSPNGQPEGFVLGKIKKEE